MHICAHIHIYTNTHICTCKTCFTPTSSYLFSNFHLMVSSSSDVSLIDKLNWRFSRQVIPGWEKAPHLKHVARSHVVLNTKKVSSRLWKLFQCGACMPKSGLPCNIRKVSNMGKLQALPIFWNNLHRYKLARDVGGKLACLLLIKVGARQTWMLITGFNASQ